MTFRKFLIVAACLAAAACRPGGRDGQTGPIAAQPIDQAQPVYREIKDWLVGCDNSRHCRAKFVSDFDNHPETMGDHSAARMVIEHQAGPDGRLTITLAIMGDEAQEKHRQSPGLFDPKTVLRLDGAPLGVKAGWSHAADGPTFAVSGDQGLAFLRAIHNGSLLAFNDGPEGPAVSLQGLMAVLLVMDEAQGRVDTRTALSSREGEGPASLVPPPVPMPVVQPAPTSAALPDAAAFASTVRKARAAVLKKHDCDAPPGRDTAHRLNATEGLALLQCIQGAYQGSFLAFTGPIADPGAAQLLKLSVPAAAEPPVAGVNPDDWAGEYGDATFDPREATLSKVSRGRGLGDCGQSAKWAFDGQSFQLIEVKYQGRCGDLADDWMVLYRAAIAKPN